jgi:hypothetical protein
LRSQVDQRVEAELVEPASHQVVEPGLSDTEAARGTGLANAPTLDLGPQCNHEF